MHLTSGACFGMSEKTQFAFWPCVGDARQTTLQWEETHITENNEKPEKDSDPEIEAQVHFMMETREYTSNTCV
jgi:hypothetical protein